MVFMSNKKKFSIVIPIFNEQENIKLLYQEIVNSIDKNIYEYEVNFVDDKSTDGSFDILDKLRKENNNVNLIENKKNYGQSFALKNGILNSRYSAILTIDGDGQNNPKDIEKITNIFFSSDYKLVGGLRLKRMDNIVKIFSSKIANLIRSKIFKDNCRDTGCSLKIFDKLIFLQFIFFNGIHRFLPALFTGLGYQTRFIEVDHRPRLFGISKYGTFKRLYMGVYDIYRVLKIIKTLKSKTNKNDN